MSDKTSKPRTEIRRLSEMVNERGALIVELHARLEAVERLHARWRTKAGPNPRWANELRDALAPDPQQAVGATSAAVAAEGEAAK